MNSNNLKIIAIITMIIDHIGYYFYYSLDAQTVLTLRIIGRIAMPLFVFMIIEGYFYTKDFKKYILRLGILAIITEFFIRIVMYVNYLKFPNYNIMNIMPYNIIFNFVILLIFIKFIDKINIDNKIIDVVLKILVFVLLCIILNYIDIDYNCYILIIGTTYFILKKLINKYNYSKIINLIILFIVFLTICVIKGNIYYFMMLSLLFIALYNGKLGKKSKVLRNLFYYIFPLQHIVLYLTAMLKY